MPLRLTLAIPLLFFVLSCVAAVVLHFSSDETEIHLFQRHSKIHLKTDLQRLRSLVKPLLENNQQNLADQLIKSYADPDLNATIYRVDSSGIILSSNHKLSSNHTPIGDASIRFPKPRKFSRMLNHSKTYIGEFNNYNYAVTSICPNDHRKTFDRNACQYLYFGVRTTQSTGVGLRSPRSQLVQSLIGFLLVAVALWLVLEWRLRYRLNRLCSSVRQFTEGDQSTRCEIDDVDEIAATATDLNTMFDAIETNRKTLEYSRAQLNAVFETAVDGIITINDRGLVQSMNTSAEKIFGYPRKDVIGHNVSLLMPKPYKDEHDSYMNNYLTTGKRKIIGTGREVLGQRNDGSVFPVELSVSEVKHGGKRSFTGVVRDISRRKFAEEQLKIREEELRLGLDNAPIGIITCDLDFHILTANRACAELLGYRESELNGRKFTDLIYNEDRTTFTDFSSNAQSHPSDSHSIGQRWVGKDGAIYYGRLHIGVAHGENDEPRMIVLQMEDTTERIKAENEARRLRDRLAHVGRVSILGEMAAGIAHEVNQPLTAIASYAEACQRLIAADMVDADELMRAMQQTASQAHRAGEVIQRLRGFAKQREAQRKSVNPNDLIKDVVELTKIDTPLQQPSLRLELSPNLPNVYADAVQIQQVLLNLIRNATDAVSDIISADPSIWIHSTQADQDLIRIDVTDNGVGIGPEDRNKIFNPFFSTKQSGMGLGLSICRSIIESHGGHLNFETRSAGGTTFYLTLPIAIED